MSFLLLDRSKFCIILCQYDSPTLIFWWLQLFAYTSKTLRRWNVSLSSWEMKGLIWTPCSSYLFHACVVTNISVALNEAVRFRMLLCRMNNRSDIGNTVSSNIVNSLVACVAIVNENLPIHFLDIDNVNEHAFDVRSCVSTKWSLLHCVWKSLQKETFHLSKQIEFDFQLFNDITMF